MLNVSHPAGKAGRWWGRASHQAVSLAMGWGRLAYLHDAGAALFDLQSTLTFTPSGALVPLKTPGELFAQFTPQPKEIDLDATARAFALIEQLEAQTNLPPPTTMTVFRLCCKEALTAAEAARRCECSKATILNRLALIRKRTGIDPARFRALSPHIAKIESQLSDPRARRIRRSSLTSDIDSKDQD